MFMVDPSDEVESKVEVCLAETFGVQAVSACRL
jgi:hypothetical protein